MQAESFYMQRDPRIYLQDVLDAAHRIETFLEEIDEIAFAGNELVQSAVYYQFAIIGEALNKFSHLAPQQATSIVDLKKVVNFRNILAHAYHRVSSDLVYIYFINELPLLTTSVKSLLAKTGKMSN
jgi:uncharacterized protein with HEPN domain